MRPLRFLALNLGVSFLAGASATAQETSPTSDEAEQASHAEMLTELAAIAAETDRSHRFLGDETARRLREKRAALTEETPPLERMKLLVLLGDEELKMGRTEEAIEVLEEASTLIPNVTGLGVSRDAMKAWYTLGVAYLRWGEDQNCVCEHCGSSCIVPFTPEAIHKDRRGSEGAMRCFLQALKEDGTHLESRWLLNLAAMTLGEFPDRVPEAYRMPKSVLAGGTKLVPFSNLAGPMGLNTFNLSGGVVVDDFDNDDDLDLMTSTFDTVGNLKYFRNDDGTFVDCTEAAGLTGLFGGLNMIHGDYDNDGFVDVYVLRGAWLGRSGRHPNSLLRNRGDGTFVDVTFAAGLGEFFFPTQTACFGDYDLDGDLDLYVGNEARAAKAYSNQLFQNQGDGTFIDVAAAAGVEDLRYTKGVVWGDFDNDRYPDLYVSNLSEPNRLYRNQGDGTFVDVAPDLGVTGPMYSFPVWFWDYDNDGVLDIYAANFVQDLAAIAASYLDMTPLAEAPALYRGDGKGGLTDVAESAGLTLTLATMGANFGDFDYNGFPDMYLGTGYPSYEALVPNVLYRNRGGRKFLDVTSASRTGHLQKGHAVSFADLDNDGDQDVFAQLGGAFRGDKYSDAFFANPGFGNHRIIVKLVGVTSNRSAIGTRVRVDVKSKDGARSIYQHVNGGGSFGAKPLRREIGIGRAEVVERMEIYWPASDETQVWTDLPADHLFHVTEGEEALTRIPLPSITSTR